MTTRARLLLVGAGHTHLEVLRRGRLDPRLGPEAVLVNPTPGWIYSGMLPGVIAGHYALEEATIDVAALAARAGAAFVADRVVALDLGQRTATLGSGKTLAYEILSLDVGSTPVPVPGAGEHALAVKPPEPLLDGWRGWLHRHAEGTLGPIAVIGGGVGGIEVLLAMHRALAKRRPPPPFLLVADELRLPPAAARRVAAHLDRRGVRRVLGSAVTRIDAGQLTLASGRAVEAEHVVVATGACAAPWLAASGLACDEGGFVRTEGTLRSVSHDFVFAAGDCATIVGAARPKAGVFAVREGPVLSGNLAAVQRGTRLRTYRPQRTWLALIATGDRDAIAVRGRIAVGGRACWLWKDRIDRAFVRRYAKATAH